MTTNRQAKKAELPEDWHPADIVAAVRKAGWSMRRIAFHHGFTPSMITKALRRPYPHAERLIAEAIGVTPEKIWPSRYDHRRPLRGVGGAPSHKGGRNTSRNGANGTTGVESDNGNATGADRQ